MSGHRAAELFFLRCVYRRDRGEGRPCVGHFSWHGMIRTTAWTQALGYRTTFGSRGLPLANTAQNTLVILTSIVCGVLLVLTSGKARELHSTLQPAIFEEFQVQTTQACFVQGKEDKSEITKKGGCRAILARYPKAYVRPYPGTTKTEYAKIKEENKPWQTRK